MERVYQINNSTLRVIFGDITSSTTDVIVSSDDEHLTMGGGISKAIRMKTGQDIYNETKKHTPACLGDVIVTGAYEMPHKYVFHSITISKDKRLIKLNNIEEDTIELQKFIVRNIVNKCCSLLINLGMNSIAFPAIGAGVARISYEIVAKEIADTITSFLYSRDEQLSVELYLMDRYGKMSEMDYIIFFEQIAIAIQSVKKSYSNKIIPSNYPKDL